MLRFPRFSGLLAGLLMATAASAQPAGSPGLTLAEATTQALQNNLRTKIAREGIAGSQAQRGVAFSALLPNLDARFIRRA